MQLAGSQKEPGVVKPSGVIALGVSRAVCPHGFQLCFVGFVKQRRFGRAAGLFYGLSDRVDIKEKTGQGPDR